MLNGELYEQRFQKALLLFAFFEELQYEFVFRQFSIVYFLSEINPMIILEKFCFA